MGADKRMQVFSCYGGFCAESDWAAALDGPKGVVELLPRKLELGGLLVFGKGMANWVIQEIHVLLRFMIDDS